MSYFVSILMSFIRLGINIVLYSVLNIMVLWIKNCNFVAGFVVKIIYLGPKLALGRLYAPIFLYKKLTSSTKGFLWQVTLAVGGSLRTFPTLGKCIF